MKKTCKHVQLIQKAMVPKLALMTSEEKARNRHSAAVRIQYDSEISKKYTSSLPGAFPDLETVHASEVEVWPKDWHVPIDKGTSFISDRVHKLWNQKNNHKSFSAKQLLTIKTF